MQEGLKCRRLPSGGGQVHDDDLEADDDQYWYENVSYRSEMVYFEQLGQQGFAMLELFPNRYVLFRS